ncbi:glutamate racemase [Neptuniibacter sp. QD37_6]|uniref:glutamate racemase n=1 Tax=Neptuniibacter sp. QD37_6 TaxID=3398210 RepID=UPI0039F45BC1
MSDSSSLPIGVFDSGVGGLTVLNALRQRLPSENLLYLGDTARVPYGTKSAVSVTRYAEQAATALVERKIKLLVIACNTASAVAVEPLQAIFPQLAVMGVVGPGAEAGCKVTRNNNIGVIATESTVNNQAYQNAILKLNPEASVSAEACSLFVALAEEGWHEGELVEQIVDRCLQPLKHRGLGEIDTLVLGCTHFPALKSSISAVMGEEVTLVDSAETTANAVEKTLAKSRLLNVSSKKGEVEFLVTDDPLRFARVATNFFSESIDVGEIQQVDIQHFSTPD